MEKDFNLWELTEDQLDEYFEAGLIDDDDWQRWHDVNDWIDEEAAEFIRMELELWK